MVVKGFRHDNNDFPSEDWVEESLNHEIKQLWADEAERRYQEFLDGKVEAVPGEETLKRIRAALKTSTDPSERSHGHHD